jgi:hypothetical protein
MSQTQSVSITRTCDAPGCTFTTTVDDKANISRFSGWYLIEKHHVLGQDIHPIALLACSDSCAMRLLDSDRLEIPKAVPDATGHSNNVLPFTGRSGKVN